jgi:transposase
LKDRPTAYLDEVALAMFDEYGVDLSEATIKRVLKKRRLIRKIVKEIAAQRSSDLRAVWRSKCDNWPVDKLCFVDESAACERTGFRKRGWSPKGVDCVVLQTLRRTERWSILPALTINGYSNKPLMIQGGVNKEIFVWWLVHHVIPFLPVRAIIVIDNASIHHNLGPLVEEMLAVRGQRIEYLPPYSPDYNPIEETFNTLKAFLRRNMDSLRLFENFRGFLKWAVEEAIGSDMRKYFKDCHYSE